MRLDLSNMIIIDSKLNKEELNVVLVGKFENMSTNLTFSDIVDLNNFLTQFIRKSRKHLKKLHAIKGGRDG